MEVRLEEFQPITEECGTCIRAVDEKELGYKRCGAYINPSYWWSGDKHCPLVAKESMSTQDVIKMAIKGEVIKRDRAGFVYQGRILSGNMSELIGTVKRNKELLADIKRKLGIQEVIEEDQGKVRVGQQKQKKGIR